jgi:tRNA (cmo5U34)-methyltransferase
MEQVKMANFDQSRWADSKFSQAYRQEADSYIPWRRLFIESAISLQQCYLSQRIQPKVLDLGCGDGLFIEELLKSAPELEAVLVDGSKEMLEAARERLSSQSKIQYIQADFQQLIDGDMFSRDFDFIFSSLAIHHLDFRDKVKLYGFIHDQLKPGGYLVIFDVVLSPSEELERWYLILWSEWLENNPGPTNRERTLPLPQRYKKNKDNQPDTLKSQLEALEKIGFQEVDCYCKYGIFSLFGGKKPAL